MVQIGYDNSGGGDYPDPIRYNLGHENRYTGTIAEVGDVQEVDDQFSDDPDATKEKIRITFRSDIDELDIDDDRKEDLKEYIKEEVDARHDEGYDDFSHPEGAVELVMFPTAKITPPVESYNSSKLFDTLEHLGLAEADDDGNVQLYDRDGNEVNPLEDVEEDDEEALNQAFSNYLQDNLTGMKVEYEINNSKRGTDDEYSAVGKVVDLVEDPEAEE